MKGTLRERFEAKFERRGPDECWLWTAGTNDGYGFVRSYENGRWRTCGAHIVAWSFANDETITSCKGWVIRHSCHNRRCVNPAHLSRGTQKQNMRDAIDRGTHIGGHNKKLAADDVRECRRLWSDGQWQQLDLAERYGISRGAVCNLIHGKTYADVE